MPSTLQVDKIIDGSATTNKELAEYASGDWSWGKGVPQHTIIQVVQKTDTDNTTFDVSSSNKTNTPFDAYSAFGS